MPRYTLNAELLREAARKKGDPLQQDICKRTGLSKSQVSKLLSGQDLTLDPLMKFVRHYRLKADALAIERKAA